MYQCIYCDFFTNDRFNLNRHINTQKHRSKVLDVSRLIDSNFNSNNIYRCPYCENFYYSNSSLSKHKVKCLDKSGLLDKQKYELKEASLKINFMDKELRLINDTKEREIELIKDSKEKELKLIVESKDKELESKQKEITLLHDKLRNIQSQINVHSSVTSSMSTIKYLNKFHSTAPPLKPITDFPALHKDMTLKEFIEEIDRQFRDKKLCQYIGDIILKEYKKDDPNEQSIWNTDSDRLTYVVKMAIDNTKEMWKIDKKAVLTIEYAIKPVLDYIYTNINSYMSTVKHPKRDEPLRATLELNDRMNRLYKIIDNIETTKLHEQVSRYISSQLFIDKEKALLN